MGCAPPVGTHRRLDPGTDSSPRATTPSAHVHEERECRLGTQAAKTGGLNPDFTLFGPFKYDLHWNVIV